MNCAEAKNLIHAYLDGELDAPHSVTIEKHLRECVACARIRQEQQALKSALGGSALQFKLPPGLRGRIVSELQPDSPAEPSWRFWWSPWFAGAATALVVALSIIFVAINFNPSLSRDRLLGELASSHVRSLMASHLMDVASTDQHTVKPWFIGKLDFSPPVADLADVGFPLVGGRLDRIEGRSAAAIVFRRRQHVINVFVWPVGESRFTPHGEREDGYNASTWSQSGLNFMAVSEIPAGELQQFIAAYRSRTE